MPSIVCWLPHFIALAPELQSRICFTALLLLLMVLLFFVFVIIVVFVGVVVDDDDVTSTQPVAQMVGRAIAALHNNNIVHGDLTTSNMMIEPANEVSPAGPSASSEGGGRSPRRLVCFSMILAPAWPNCHAWG